MSDKPSGLKAPSKLSSNLPRQAGNKPGTSLETSTANSMEKKDDFVIGDKVLVSGSKPGKILFLGETQFAPGQWAGIVLDKPVGKNDGSVGGVRYFQCEPLHGVFARPSKLAKVTGSLSSPNGDAKPVAKKPVVSKVKAATSKPTKAVPLTEANLKAAGMTGSDRPKPAGVRSPASSIRSLKLGGTPRASSKTVTAASADIKVGDRVAVGETKVGVARYIGETEFAKGCWVGIELDDPQGKNDGSVAGKRYFTCAVNHGLFALIHKVQKVGLPSGRAKLSSTTRKPGVRASVGSAASVSSLSSVSSTNKAAAGKIRTEVSTRYKQKTTAMGVQALQEALQEKQQHVESLLAERDMERDEMVGANILVAEKQAELLKLQEAHNAYVQEKEEQLDALRVLVEQADRDKVKLAQDVEEQMRKVEDLQFQLEEEEICKDDLQSELTQSKGRVKELESGIHIEREKTFNLQSSLEQTRASTVGDKSELDTLQKENASAQKRIEELTAKLETVGKVQSTSDSSDSRLFELEEQLVEAQASVEDHSVAVAEAKKKIQSIEEEKNDLLNLVQDLEMQVTTAQEARQKSSTDHEEESEKLKQEISSLHEKINRAEQENLRLHKESQDYLQSSGDSNAQMKTLARNIQVKEEEMSELKSLLEQHKDSIQQLEGKRQHEEKHKTVALEELKSQQEELAKLRSLNQSLEENLSKRAEELVVAKQQEQDRAKAADESLENMKTTNKELESKCFEVEEKLAEKENEIEKLSVDKSSVVDEYESKMEDLKEQLREVERIKQNNEDQVVRVSEQLANLHKVHNDAVQNMTQQSGEMTQQLIAQLKEAQELNSKQQNEIDELNKRLSTLMDEKNYSQKNVEDVNGMLHSLEEENKSLCSQLDASKHNHDDLNKKFTNLQASHDESEAARNIAEASLAMEEAAKAELSREVAELQDKLEESGKIVKSLSSEKHQLEEEQNKLRDGVTSANERVTMLEGEIEKINEETNKLQENLAMKNKEANESYCELEMKKNELERTNEKLSQHAQDIVSLKEKLELAQVEGEQRSLRAVESENALLNIQSEKRTLEDKLASILEEQGSVEQKSFEYLDKIQTLEKHNVKLSSDVQTQVETCKKLQSSLNEVTSEKVQHLNRCEELQRIIDSCKEEKILMETSIKEMKEQVDQFLLREEQFKSDVARINEERDNLKEQCQAHESMIETSKSDLSAISSKLATSTDVLERMKVLVSEKEEAVNILQSNLNDKSASEIKLQEEVSSLKQQITEHLDKFDKVEVELKSAKDELETLSTEKKEIESNHQALTREKDDLSAEADRCRGSIDSMKLDLAELTSAKQQLHEELEQSKAANDALSAQSDSYRSNISLQMEELTNQKQQLSSERDDVIAQIKNLRKNLIEEQDTRRKADVELKNLEEKNNEMSLKFTGNETERDAMSEEVKKLQCENKSLLEQTDLLNSQIGETTNRLTELQTEKEDLAKKLSASSELNDHLKTEVEESSLKLITAQAELDLEKAGSNQLQVNISDMETELNNLKETLKIYQDSHQETTSKLESTSSNLSEVTQSCDDLRKELAQLKESHADAEASKSSLEVKLQGVLHDLELSRGSSDAEMKSLREEASSLREELEGVKNQKASVDHKLISTAAELKSETDNHQVTSSNLAELKVELDSMKGQIALSRAECEEVKEQLSTKQSEVAGLRESNQGLSKRVDEANSLVEEKDARLANMEQSEATLRATLDARIEDLTNQLAQVGAEKSNISEQLIQEKESIRIQMESMQTSSNKDSTLANSRIEELMKKNADLSQQNQVFHDELDKIKDRLSDREQKFSESELKITELLRHNEALSDGSSKTQSELENALQRLNEADQKYVELESTFKRHSADAQSYVDKVKCLEEENKNLLNLKDTLESKVGKLEKREKVLKREFAEERDSLQKSIDITTSLLDANNKEMEILRNEVTTLKSLVTSNEASQSTINRLEREKQLLQEQLHQAEESINDSNSRMNDSVAPPNSSGDADFLNKVIANQQSKIESLNAKIKELEHIMLNGEAEDDDDEYMGERPRAAPRLFCDICDVFDAHDTEDCPTQSMGNPEEDHGASQTYERGKDRPYCDDCEVFGHWTEACEAEEMY